MKWHQELMIFTKIVQIFNQYMKILIMNGVNTIKTVLL